MSVFLKVLKTVTRYVMYVCYCSVMAMMALTVFNVIRRYIIQNPLSGSTEWSQIFLIICMTALAHAVTEGRFVAVDTIVNKFPRPANIAVEIIAGGIAIVFFAVVGSQLLVQGGASMASGETYYVITAPRWPVYFVFGIAFLSCILGTIVYVIERIRNLKPTAPTEKQETGDATEGTDPAKADGTPHQEGVIA